MIGVDVFQECLEREGFRFFVAVALSRLEFRVSGLRFEI